MLTVTAKCVSGSQCVLIRPLFHVSGGRIRCVANGCCCPSCSLQPMVSLPKLSHEILVSYLKLLYTDGRMK